MESKILNELIEWLYGKGESGYSMEECVESIKKAKISIKIEYDDGIHFDLIELKSRVVSELIQVE